MLPLDIRYTDKKGKTVNDPEKAYYKEVNGTFRTSRYEKPQMLVEGVWTEIPTQKK